jgi:hypothetical protein
MVGIQAIEHRAGILHRRMAFRRLDVLHAHHLHLGVARLGLFPGQITVTIGVELGKMCAHLFDHAVAGLGLHHVDGHRVRNRMDDRRGGRRRRRLRDCDRGRGERRDGDRAHQKLLHDDTPLKLRSVELVRACSIAVERTTRLRVSVESGAIPVARAARHMTSKEEAQHA